MAKCLCEYCQNITLYSTKYTPTTCAKWSVLSNYTLGHGTLAPANEV